MQSPPMDRTYALFLYEPPITRLILDLKFGHALLNSRILGELLAEKIKNEWYCDKPLPEIIFPIPLHNNRLKERGFNQALEITKPLAKLLDLPIENSACQRIKPTAAQATLLAEQRKHNILNAFQISTSLNYHHVAIVDDVITTGHTVMEFSKHLKKAGVNIIDVWCCARPRK